MKTRGIIIASLVSLFIIAFAGSAAAYNAAYTHTIYMSSTVPTIDGQYTGNADWIESGAQTFGANGNFRDEWTLSPNYVIIIVETADATNNAGDYWVLCYDSTAAGGATEPDGGATPQTSDYKIVVTGHGPTATVQWYRGTGTGWTPVTATATTYQLAQSLSASPFLGTPHYILELLIDKSSTELGGPIMGYNWAQYIAYYDAENGGNGLQSWPPAPASPDVPDSWGYIQYAYNANPTPDVPEGIGFAVMATVSTVALVAGTYYVRKRVKT